MAHRYYVYMLTNPHHTVIYTGVTNDLVRRVGQHRAKEVASFTQRYNASKLIPVGGYDQIAAAIEREKQIKSWSRRRKMGLITHNPEWVDLFE